MTVLHLVDATPVDAVKLVILFCNAFTGWYFLFFDIILDYSVTRVKYTFPDFYREIWLWVLD